MLLKFVILILEYVPQTRPFYFNMTQRKMAVLFLRVEFITCSRPLCNRRDGVGYASALNRNNKTITHTCLKISNLCRSQCLTDVGIAFSEVQQEEGDEGQVYAASRNVDTASRNPEPAAVNSNTEGWQKTDKEGPSEEELELIAALEKANAALEEEAKAAKAAKQDEELVAALERANQGTG